MVPPVRENSLYPWWARATRLPRDERVRPSGDVHGRLFCPPETEPGLDDPEHVGEGCARRAVELDLPLLVPERDEVRLSERGQVGYESHRGGGARCHDADRLVGHPRIERASAG